ncbi:hypothetical protein Trydic_g18018 [Trypoxylus dichotomus]
MEEEALRAAGKEVVVIRETVVSAPRLITSRACRLMQGRTGSTPNTRAHVTSPSPKTTLDGAPVAPVRLKRETMHSNMRFLIFLLFHHRNQEHRRSNVLKELFARSDGIRKRIQITQIRNSYNSTGIRLYTSPGISEPSREYEIRSAPSTETDKIEKLT